MLNLRNTKSHPSLILECSFPKTIHLTKQSCQCEVKSPDDRVDGAVEIGQTDQRQQVEESEGTHRADLRRYKMTS